MDVDNGDKATPKSARGLRPRTTPRGVKVREIPVNLPSQVEVAVRLLTRSRSAKKRKAPSASAATPSDSTTPRTLISGFLQTAPVAKSAVKTKKLRMVPSDTNGTTTVTSRESLHDDNTPRSTIQNVLQEAIAETPVEPIFSPSTETEDDMLAQQTNEGENHSPLTRSSASYEAKTDPVVQSDDRETTYNHTNDMDMEAITRLQDSHEESHEDTMQNTSGNELSELGSVPSMVTTDQALQTDAAIGDDAVQHSGQWQDLITPKLPLNIYTAGGRHLSTLKSDGTKRVDGEKNFFGGKPPTGKIAAKSSKKPRGPKMPTDLVKNIFQHFSKAKLSKEALQAVENGSQLFFKQVSSDLMAYCGHAHRATIELADVELLMRRQGFITENQSLYSLVEKYLPLEYRKEIIPTVQAGNKIVLK